MKKGEELLSNIAHYRTYRKYIPDLKRRESYAECIDRYESFMIDQCPQIKNEIIDAVEWVRAGKILPSMRLLQFAGASAAKNNMRAFNCTAVNIMSHSIISEIVYVLLSGAGVGYSVRKRHIMQMNPIVAHPFIDDQSTFVIPDSIEGWAQAFKRLFNSYFTENVSAPQFDYSQISAAGIRLNSGVIAPGPEALKKSLEMIETRLIKARGRRLTSLEVSDIICIAADCVVSGGVRRSALIALFDWDDNLMLYSKHFGANPDWYKDHPYRERANISAALNLFTTTRYQFDIVFGAMQSGFGDPGIIWFCNDDGLVNPCAEIALKHAGGCNLTDVNMSAICNPYEFGQAVKHAAILGTAQATLTNFPFLSDVWKKQFEEEALVGVGLTGIQDNINLFNPRLLSWGAAIVKSTNKKFAGKLGINPAARTTTIKPSGTSSTVLGCSSGIHNRFSEYYIRRMRISETEPLAKYLLNNLNPLFIESAARSKYDVVVGLPIHCPNYIERSLEENYDIALTANKHWVKNGHNYGDDTNNVSLTLTPMDHEWQWLREKMWDDRGVYRGISVFPKDNTHYVQAPYEAISKEKYEEMVKYLPLDLDLTKIMEAEDTTDMESVVACAGGKCDII